MLQLRLDVREVLGQLPLLWSAEDPALYTLVVTLKNEEGTELEHEACQVSINNAWHQLRMPSLAVGRLHMPLIAQGTT